MLTCSAPEFACYDVGAFLETGCRAWLQVVVHTGTLESGLMLVRAAAAWEKESEGELWGVGQGCMKLCVPPS